MPKLPQRLRILTAQVQACKTRVMPPREPEDHGAGETNNRYCVYCTDETGKLKKPPTVRRGDDRISHVPKGNTREEAEGFVDEQIKKLPGWKDK